MRQFCYAPDLAYVIIWVLENYNEVTPLNIAGTEISIKDLIIKITKKLNINSDKIIFDLNYSDGPLYRTISDDKIKKIYSNYKYTDIDVALETTINSAKNMYEQ